MVTITDIEPLGPYARLRLETDLALVEIIPARGGLVSRYAVGGEDLLYLDEATVVDPAKSVRGGIPVLWPIAGKLPDDHYEWDGKSYSMKQHGFARNMAWEVVTRHTDSTGACVMMRLLDDPTTLAQYPWRFEVRLTVLLRRADLRIGLEVENPGDTPMPHVPGYHPYFRVRDADKPNVEVETDATWATDNRTDQAVDVDRPDFTQETLDLHLEDHRLPGTLLKRPPLRPVRLSWDEGFDWLVLWTQKGKDFVCVEPWGGPAGALARKKDLRFVQAGEVERTQWMISV